MAVNVVRRRLSDFFAREMNVIGVEGVIYAEFVDNGNMGNLLAAVQQQGTLEIIDLSGISLEERAQLLGNRVKTTGYERPEDDATINPLTGLPFETVVRIENPVFANLLFDDGQWHIQITPSYANSQQLLAFTSANVGELMGIVLDGVLVSAPLIERPIVTLDVVNDAGGWDVMTAQRITNVLRMGPLPFPLRVVEYEILN